MAWAKLNYSRREVNEAGAHLVNVSIIDDSIPIWRTMAHAVDVVDNFRAAHAFPLNTLQKTLRTHAGKVDPQSIVAQRLKRFSSILIKLRRFETMKLWDMQDIGGCRAIVHSLNDVQKLVDAFKSSHIRHRLSHEDDYIQQPRDSGYRSRHLVYRYISDRSEVYNGLRVEIQIRTPPQHAWATTVETVDAFTEQALKSSLGSPDWERFFQLMGTEMAFREGTPLVSGTPTDIRELRKELKGYADSLQVINKLASFTAALRITKYASAKDKNADYFLLSLDNIKDHLSVTGYNRRQLKRASKAYANKEKQIRDKKGNDAVLVSVDSIRNLQRAYPNYFADTRIFVDELKEALRKY